MALKEDTKPSNSANAAMARSTGRKSMSPLRHRPLGRASTFADLASPRRSSNMSGSIDDARQSILSSTDDLLLPRVDNRGLRTHHESSYWHSAPLAMALFPAVGGLLFQNGSAVVTDLTLLGIAAVLLNWSVRLPWEWYRSAHSVRPSSTPPTTPPPRDPSDIILEADEDSVKEYPTPPELQPPLPSELQDPQPPAPFQSAAASELRIHELLALFACFISPIIGAWLLHHIRCQLSRPSEGLVSNYNLTIFLLASELRPLSHLAKMVQARTLFLQRSLTPSERADLATVSPATISTLTSRLDELETYFASNAQSSKPNGAPTNPQTNNNELLAQLRKSLTPDIEALNRAVRRYEKRATLLAMQTEARLADQEARMGDAITLAAAAERGVSNFQKKSSVAVIFEWGIWAAMLPMQAGYAIVALPMRAGKVALGSVEGWISGNVRREVRTATGRGSSESGRERRIKGRGAKKAM